MNKNAIWLGLAVSACGLALVSTARAGETSTDSMRAAAASGEKRAQASARLLPATARPSPLIVLLGSGLVAIAIGWAAVRKYVASPSA